MSKFWNWIEKTFYSKEVQNINERSVIEFILSTPKYRITAKLLAEHLGIFTKYAKQKLSLMNMKGVLADNMFLDNIWEKNYVLNKKRLPKLSEQYPDLAEYFQQIDKHTHSFLGNFKEQDFANNLARLGERLGEKLNNMLKIPENTNQDQKNLHKNPENNSGNNNFSRPNTAIMPNDSQIIQWALENQNTITATMLCVKANISIEKAREILEKLHLKQVFDIEVNDKGTILYRLQEM